MPRWVCTAAAAAAWPVAMTLGVVLISPPVLVLYDSGAIGASPAAPMTFITIVSLALSVLLSASIYALLHAYCEYEDAHHESRDDARAAGADS